MASLAKALTGAGVRTHVDDRVDVGFGRRSIEWELKGVPELCRYRADLDPHQGACFGSAFCWQEELMS